MKSVINLIKTSQGYSIIEGDNEVNKTTSKPHRERTYSLPKKFVPQNFTIYPYIYNKDGGDNNKYLLLPAKTQWFNMNFIHEIEKKALPEWFKVKKGILATMNNIKFEKHEELYKRYRNYIIELAKDSYLSPMAARKGLAGDVCSIMRIHKFLEKWGLINYIHKKYKKEEKVIEQPSSQNHQKSVHSKDCFDKDKLIVSRSYAKDDLQLLKKVTKKLRPWCHYCDGIVGVVWYTFKENVIMKDFIRKENKRSAQIQNRGEPFSYEFRVCASCFYDGNIPIILNHKDFTKFSVLDKFTGSNPEHDKKVHEFNKIAEAIEKSSFNVKKAAALLKIEDQKLLNNLMRMPIQRLEKLSRIEPETDEDEHLQKANTILDHKDLSPYVNGESLNGIEKHSERTDDSCLKEDFRYQLQQLELKERELYEEMLMSWLMKVAAKMERLTEWESGVLERKQSANRFQKINLADQLKKASKRIINEERL